jgi:hypothetical protein
VKEKTGFLITVLEKDCTISGEVRNAKSSPLGERETVWQVVNRIRFTSDVLGVRTTCPGEKDPISYLFSNPKENYK